MSTGPGPYGHPPGFGKLKAEMLLFSETSDSPAVMMLEQSEDWFE